MISSIEWAEQAACRGSDTNQFYPPGKGNTKYAKKLCGKCTVRQECLEWVLTNVNQYNDHGIWGGLTLTERTRIRNRREKDAPKAD